MGTDSWDVCIVGAGLAGLGCAIELQRAGRSCVLLERDRRPGGRVQTDAVGGYQLDRGFQILLSAYPETQRLLDYGALDLRSFEPGALVHLEDGFHRVADPLRRPGRILETLTSPIGSLADKLRLAALSLRVRTGPARELLRREDRSTLEALHELGFSSEIIEKFFRPFFSGIQLDPELEVTRRRFEIIFRMLAVGDSCVPARGMGAIPAQLAERLPDHALRTGVCVEALEGTSAKLESGETISARALVVATDGTTAARLLQWPEGQSRPASCVYFSAPTPPEYEAHLCLEGVSGPAKNLIVPSNLSAAYAPPGRALIAAAIPGSLAGGAPGVADEPDAAVAEVRQQLRGWFGERVDDWEHLRTYRIAHGHPDQRPPFEPKQTVRLGGNRYVCGDHRDTASIQGALYSGWRAARAVLNDLR